MSVDKRTFRYYKSAISAILHGMLTQFIKYKNKKFVEIAVAKINGLLGKNVITVDDIMEEFAKLHEIIKEETKYGYFDSLVPHTHKLILRDKIFTFSHRLIPNIIKKIEERLQ